MCLEFIRQWRGDIWREKYNETLRELDQCRAENKVCFDTLVVCQQGNTPAPVVNEKDKHLKSGFWMQAAISKIPDCKLIHYPLDGKYVTANKDVWRLLVAWDWVNTRKYLEDFWDCEDYAILFKGRSVYYFGLNSCAVVIDYSSGHAYNLIVYPDGEAEIFEPQDDLFIPVIGRNIKLYGLQEGAILL